MSESKNLTKQVEEINTELRAFGRAAVQEIKMMKDGKVIGQIRYGYKPQYVFDAVNSILLPENWRYEVVSKEIFDSQVVAEVRLFIRVNDNEWICKGSQTGQMQIVKGNVGDSYKGAITDAIQKCLSLLSIGTDAYRGLLRDVYLAGNRPDTSPPKQQSEQPARLPTKTPAKSNSDQDQARNNTDLPKIAGRHDCYFQKALHRIRLDDSTKAEYLEYVFLFYSKYNGFKNVSNKATISHLTGEKLKATSIPIPPLSLQKKFAFIVEKVEQSQNHYHNNLNELQNLFGALSQKAFKGELDVSEIPAHHQLELHDTITLEDEIALTHVKSDILSVLKSYGKQHVTFTEFLKVYQDQEDIDFPEYETVKERLFSLIKQGKVIQTFDESSNQIVLAAKG